ncbi:MAG: methionyl-tRNA formyltransferase, partial [Alphaproteobacteria bacterium]|nr:methionyl-tRNA formyltransferase [Alphaproteobacteria bacterium]
MEEGLDTGPVFETLTFPIGPEMTAGEVHDALAKAAKEPLISTLNKLERGKAEATPQNDEDATYAKKIRKDETKIDWSEPAKVVDQRIRALSPFPGAWFEADGERIKALRSRVVDQQGEPGDVIDNTELVIACGEGAIQLLELQRAGKKPARAEEVLRGFSLPVGTRLG